MPSFDSKRWLTIVVRFLLSLYLSFVFVGKTLIDLCYLKRVILAATGRIYPYLLYLLIFALAFAAFYLALCWLSRHACSLFQVHIKMGRWPAGLFTAVFLAVLLYYLAQFCLCYPGGISTDNTDQWNQVHTFALNDHHPAFHTLLLWGLTRLYDSYSFIILIQLILLASGIACLAATLRAWGIPSWAVTGTVLLLALGEQTQDILFYAWKDTAMSLLVLWLLTPVTHIFLSKGKWLNKPLHWIGTAILLACITLVRHNAVLFTLPFLVLLFCTYGNARKSSFLAGVLCILLVLGVKGPLYHALKVTPADDSYSEMIGLPMTILSSVYSQEPESLSEEAYQFMSSLAEQETFRQAYTFGDYNSVKRHFGINQEKITQASPSPWKLLGMAWDTVRRETLLSAMSVVELTDMVWEPIWEEVVYFGVGHGFQLGDSDLTIHPVLRDLCSDVRDVVRGATRNPAFVVLTSQLGILILAMMLCWYISQREHGFTGLWLILPILLYNFGTMLLLCGDDARFFHFNCFAAYPIAILLLSRSASEPAESIIA